MRIGEALPEIFKRSYPLIQPKTEMLLAVSLLKFHQIDALPIEFKASRKKQLAVFGYSCLASLLETSPKKYKKFLSLPAIEAALELSTVDIDSEIAELLKVFQKTKFGFAWVKSDKLGGFASLRDLLGLYEIDSLETGLELGDLSSPIFSLPARTSIKEVLRSMFTRRIRRIFVEGTDSAVTDRRIISHLFSSSNVERASKEPETLLDLNLGDISTFEPPKVRITMKAKEGAQLMRLQSDECLVTDKGIVTPWDMIMKPLAQGALKISK